MQVEEASTVESVQTRALEVPRIGSIWPGEGGVYAGLARGKNGGPDCHVILALAEPDKRLAWAPALEWAKTVEADGHTDFTVPSRGESALLYANLQDHFDQTAWYWTSTQYSQDVAFNQDFYDGGQGHDDKEYEARVRAVRRFAA